MLRYQNHQSHHQKHLRQVSHPVRRQLGNQQQGSIFVLDMHLGFFLVHSFSCIDLLFDFLILILKQEIIIWFLRIRMSPAARKMMEEYNISSPQTVPATGPHGMVNKGWELINKLLHSWTCKTPFPTSKKKDCNSDFWGSQSEIAKYENRFHNDFFVYILANTRIFNVTLL